MPNFTMFDSLLNKQTSTKKVSKKEYEIFCKEYLFDSLRDTGFGRAFCERFEFDDLYLKNLSDDTARFHIEKLGYIRFQ